MLCTCRRTRSFCLSVSWLVTISDCPPARLPARLACLCVCVCVTLRLCRLRLGLCLLSIRADVCACVCISCHVDGSHCVPVSVHGLLSVCVFASARLHLHTMRRRATIRTSRPQYHPTPIPSDPSATRLHKHLTLHHPTPSLDTLGAPPSAANRNLCSPLRPRLMPAAGADSVTQTKA